MKKLTLLLAFFFLAIFSWAQTFNGTGGPLRNDNGGRGCFPLTVSGVSKTLNTTDFGLASVCINLTHTGDEEIDIFLYAPDGTQVILSNENGGTGDNYTNTCFSASALTYIKLGSPPFTGSFIPEGSLGAVNNGQSADGVWSLCVFDRRNTGNTGSLLNWSITFNNTPAPPAPVMPSKCAISLPVGGTCAGAPLICNFDGACGSTGGTQQSWPALVQPFSCFGINNNTFVRFIPSAATATFSVWVNSSNTFTTSGNLLNAGIQILVFGGTCGGTTLTKHGCYNHIYPDLPTVVYATGLTPGNTYYLMFDGLNGDRCDFIIGALTGVNILNITADKNPVCSGDNVQLTASGGNGIYSWTSATGNPATAAGTTITAIAPPVGNTIYKVTSVTPTGCPLDTSITIKVNAKPTLTITNPAPICAPATADLTAASVTAGSTAGLTYTYWQNAIATIPYATPGTAVAATYYIKGTDASGCSDIQAVTVSAGAATPVTSFSYNTPVCSSATNPLPTLAPGFTTGGTFSSFPSGLIISAATGQINMAGSNAGSYTITYSVAASGCSSAGSSTAPITIAAAPAAPTLAGFNICGSSTIIASGFTGTLTWSDGGSGNPRNFTVAGGPYTVTQTIGGCTSNPSNGVSVAPLITPVPVLAVADNCGSSTITASGFTGTLTWSDGGSGNPRTFNTAGGPYTVTQTIGACTSVASNAVNVAPVTAVAPVLTVVNNCGSSTVTASGFTGTLTWSDGGSGNPRIFTTAGGPYTVTQTIGACTSLSSNAVSAAPLITPPPTLAVANNCGNSTVTASGFTGTLLWSDGGSGNPRNFTVAGGPYTVTQTISGCASVVSNPVSVAPIIAAAPVLTVVDNCGSSTVTVTGFTGTLTWSDGGSGNPRNFTTAGGPYTVTQTISGCTSIASNAVSVSPNSAAAPVLTVADNCGNSTITASGFTGTLTWSDGGSGNPRNFTTVSGPYTVTQTIGTCTSVSSNAVSVNPSSVNAPILTVTNNCGNSTITASGFAGTLSWSDGGSGNPRSFTTASGPFTVTQTIGACTSVASNSVAANPASAAAPILTVVDNCGSSTVTASGFTGTLTWSDGGTGNPRTFTTAGGPYTVTQTIGSCVSPVSNVVAVNPVIVPAPSVFASDGCGLTLLIVSGFTGTLNWSDGGSGNPRTVFIPGSFSVTQTVNGCTSAASNLVTAAPVFVPAPVLSVQDACGSSTITASNISGTLTWNDGGVGDSRVFNTAGGPYTVTQTVGVCVSPASNAVSVAPIFIPAPLLSVMNNCGNSVASVATATGTITWNDGALGKSRTFSVAGGPYTVTETINGCVSPASNAVSVTPAIAVSPVLTVQNNCGNTIATAKGFTGTLRWSDGRSENPRTFTTAGGPYTVTQTIGNCTSAPSNAIMVDPIFTPAPVLSVQDGCSSSTITATGFTGTLTWSDGGSGNPRNFTTAGGPYTVTQKIGACTSVASNAVAVSPLVSSAPVLTVQNNCGSSIVTASAFTGNLVWSDGGSGTSRTFTTAGGPYTVLQSVNGCSSNNSNAVSVVPKAIPAAPVLTVLSSCTRSTITASGFTGSLTWNDGAIGNSRIFTADGGPYTVTQTVNGCTSAASNAGYAQLTQSGFIPLLGGDVTLCPGEQLVLDPGVYAQYLWQDNSTARRFTVTQNGTYAVVVTDADGCKFTDAVSVKVLSNCSEVYFPSAFSPNGDGNNETFGALGNLRDITNYTLYIFDRFGNIIFSTTDPYKRWDGRHKGIQVNINNYVWTATYTYKGTEKRTEKGNLVLLR